MQVKLKQNGDSVKALFPFDLEIKIDVEPRQGIISDEETSAIISRLETISKDSKEYPEDYFPGY